jgi:hypothetical protein
MPRLVKRRNLAAQLDIQSRRVGFLVGRVFFRARKDGGACGSNVSYWHKADVTIALCNVRFRGQSGRTARKTQ